MNNKAADFSSIQTDTFDTWVNDMQSRTENVLAQHLPATDIIPERLHEAMRYATLDGGKRVRALLAYASAAFCGASTEKVDLAAAAVELIHAFSLVHDDMPCMDDDDLRRGKLSTHKKYGDALALLVGDALQSLAFQLISQDGNIQDKSKMRMLNLLAIATGSQGMAGGQALDLESTGVPLTQTALETMHLHKTGALIRAAALLGAHSGNPQDEEKIQAIEQFAKSIGLAFQVIDDILDAEGDTETLGKTAGKDAKHNKSTYVTILGLPAAKTFANNLHANAMSVLSPYGREADLLRHLANFITQRTF